MAALKSVTVTRAHEVLVITPTVQEKTIWAPVVKVATVMPASAVDPASAWVGAVLIGTAAVDKRSNGGEKRELISLAR